MNQDIKNKLKALPKATCFKCKSKRSRGNPMVRCFECGKKFCYEHIWNGQFKDGMKQNDGLRDICDSCKEKNGYRAL